MRQQLTEKPPKKTINQHKGKDKTKKWNSEHSIHTV